MRDVCDKGNTADRGPGSAAAMIESVRKWAERRDDIRALVLVGSHARGDARSDSDIDLVLLCTDPAGYVLRTDWVSAFGEVVRSSLEDWGKVQSVRVLYRNGTEVEFGVTGLDWAAIPPDRGTSDVLGNGTVILLDRGALLSRVMQVMRGFATPPEGR